MHFIKYGKKPFSPTLPSFSQMSVHIPNALQKLVSPGLKYYILKANILYFFRILGRICIIREACAKKMKGNVSPWSPLQN